MDKFAPIVCFLLRSLPLRNRAHQSQATSAIISVYVWLTFSRFLSSRSNTSRSRKFALHCDVGMAGLVGRSSFCSSRPDGAANKSPTLIRTRSTLPARAPSLKKLMSFQEAYSYSLGLMAESYEITNAINRIPAKGVSHRDPSIPRSPTLTYVRSTDCPTQRPTPAIDREMLRSH